MRHRPPPCGSSSGARESIHARDRAGSKSAGPGEELPRREARNGYYAFFTPLATLWRGFGEEPEAACSAPGSLSGWPERPLPRADLFSRHAQESIQMRGRSRAEKTRGEGRIDPIGM